MQTAKAKNKQKQLSGLSPGGCLLFLFSFFFTYGNNYMIDKRLSFWPQSLQANLISSDGTTPQKYNAIQVPS